MRSAKKTDEELLALRRSLVSRLMQERPDIAQAARWIREALGLNQMQFAELVGLSKPQIAKLERGEANPTLETLLAIGKPFGLQVAFYHPTATLTPVESAQAAATHPSPLTTEPIPQPQVFEAKRIRRGAKGEMPVLNFKKKPA